MRRSALLVALAVTLLVVLAVPCAHAVTATAPTTTISALYTGATGVEYTFTGFTLSGSQLCDRVDVTFPAGTDVAGATAVSPAGTVAVSGQTVSITFNADLPKGSAVTLVIGGITNPPTPIAGATATLGFYVAKNWKGPFTLENPPLASGPYDIVSPHLNLTLSSSALTFDLTPDVVAPPQNVTLTVDSSHPYTITRDITGQVSEIGLTVTGGASGAYAAGIASYVDQYSASASWTTTPAANYTANVSYSVVQQ